MFIAPAPNKPIERVRSAYEEARNNFEDRARQSRRGYESCDTRLQRDGLLKVSAR